MLLRNIHYGLMNALLLTSLASLCIGGSALWLTIVAGLILSTLVDEAAGDNKIVEAKAPYRFLNAMLFLTLPLMALNFVAMVLLYGTGDALGLVPALRIIGIDIAAARAASSPWHLFGGLMGLGLMIGAAATNVAHELTHRTGSPASMLTGRWLLAFSFDTTFSIEHVYGHHRNVCTSVDPASARRNSYSLAFFVRSTIGCNIAAWRIETARLTRKGESIWSLSNRVITGTLMSLLLLVLAYALGGIWAVLAFVFAGLHGKLYLELVNYIEHYGLVRVPGSSVEPRHSWNTYHAVSSGMLYNLPRHANHHRFATKPFWTLQEEPEGPNYPYGYTTMILLSLFPPLWHRVVDPLLAEWDRTMASDAERAILAAEGTLFGDGNIGLKSGIQPAE